MYKLAKQRDISRDLVQAKCIKDEDQRVLFLEEDIQYRWMRYFDKLFNKGHVNLINFCHSCSLNDNKDFTDFCVLNDNKPFYFY